MNEVGSNPENKSETNTKELILNLQNWLKFFLSKWVIIFLFGIFGGIIGVSYAFLKVPVYMATTTFVLESGESSGGLGQYSGLASMVGIDIGGGAGGGIFQGDNIIELYKSRTMIEKTLFSQVEKQGKQNLLIEYYIEFNHLRDHWNKDPQLKTIHFDLPSKSGIQTKTRVQDSIISVIVSDIKKDNLNVIRLDKKLSIIEVNVSSKNEFFAKNFNDQLVKNVNDFYVQTKTKKSLDNVLILQQKTDSVRAVMNNSIFKASVVSDATPNLNSTRLSQRVAPVQQSQFSAETNKAVLSELLKNLELSKISARKEAPLIQVVDQPIFPLFKEKVSKAKALVIGFIISIFFISICLIIKKTLQDTLGS